MAFDLTGKLALVTGCRTGIGKSIAIALASQGADIIGVSSTLAEEDEVRTAVRAAGRTFHLFKVDLSTTAGAKRLVSEVAERSLSPDIIVLNAGKIHRAPADKHEDEPFASVMEFNVCDPVIMPIVSREFGKGMLERKTGKIVFLASLMTFQGGLTVPSYAASKGAIGQLTKALANEWAAHGVCVNAIAPGYIATDFTQALQDNPERNSSILSRIPAGRWGHPDDIAGTAVFLASRASDYVNGAVIPVDGGWMGR